MTRRWSEGDSNFWSHLPSVPLSHGGNTCSNPVEDAKKIKPLQIKTDTGVPLVSCRRGEVP